MFASRARPGSSTKRGLVRVRVETLERVKEVLEHLSLYIGLAIYTALGAKVDDFCWKEISNLTGHCCGLYFVWRGKLGIICCDIFIDQQKIPGHQSRCSK